jgi:hypothetical protein
VALWPGQVSTLTYILHHATRFFHQPVIISCCHLAVVNYFELDRWAPLGPALAAERTAASLGEARNPTEVGIAFASSTGCSIRRPPSAARTSASAAGRTPVAAAAHSAPLAATAGSFPFSVCFPRVHPTRPSFGLRSHNTSSPIATGSEPAKRTTAQASAELKAVRSTIKRPCFGSLVGLGEALAAVDTFGAEQAVAAAD